MKFRKAARACRQGVARVRGSFGVSVLNVRPTHDGFVVLNWNHSEAERAEEWIESRKDWAPMDPKDAVTRLGDLV